MNDKLLTLNNASVGLEAALPQLVEVVQHVGVGPVHLRLTGLHEGLQDVVQVLPELRPSGESHVPEHGEDLGLDTAVDRVVAEVGEENLHDLVAPLEDPGDQGSADVTHQTHGSVTHLERGESHDRS